MKRLWTASFRSGFSDRPGGRLYPVQAGEIDALHLINLLKQKGVLTQEEADGLMKEARKQAKAEKEALKAEIKQEGEKGAYLPKALKDFGFSTTIFAEWNMKDHGKRRNNHQSVPVEPGLSDLEKEAYSLAGHELDHRTSSRPRTPMMSARGWKSGRSTLWPNCIWPAPPPNWV